MTQIETPLLSVLHNLRHNVSFSVSVGQLTNGSQAVSSTSQAMAAALAAHNSAALAVNSNSLSAAHSLAAVQQQQASDAVTANLAGTGYENGFGATGSSQVRISKITSPCLLKRL